MDVLVDNRWTLTGNNGIVGFSVDDLLTAILAEPPKPPENDSYPASVRGPVDAAEAYTNIPD